MYPSEEMNYDEQKREKECKKLIKYVLMWANENRTDRPTFENCYLHTLKLLKKVGELAEAIEIEDSEQYINAIGNIAVHLIVLAKQNTVQNIEKMDFDFMYTPRNCYIGNLGKINKFSGMMGANGKLFEILQVIFNETYPEVTAVRLEFCFKKLDDLAQWAGVSLLCCLREAVEPLWDNNSENRFDGFKIYGGYLKHIKKISQLRKW